MCRSQWLLLVIASSFLYPEAVKVESDVTAPIDTSSRWRGSLRPLCNLKMRVTHNFSDWSLPSLWSGVSLAQPQSSHYWAGIEYVYPVSDWNQIHTYLESRRVGSYPCHSKREEHHRQVSAERIICLFKCILSTGETFTSPNMRFIRPACFLRFYDTLESRQMHSLLFRSEYENLIHYITFTHSISLCSTKWFRLSFGGRDRPIDFQ